MSVFSPFRVSSGPLSLNPFPSIRAKIRDGVDDYNTFDEYWLRCLYKNEKGDPEDVEKGFLQSNLLVKVRISLPFS